MILKANSPIEIYIEVFIFTYILTLFLFILLFSSTSAFKLRSLIFISDIGIQAKYNFFRFYLFYLFCMLGGIPPFFTFISKYYLFLLVDGTLGFFFLIFFLLLLFIYYLSVFKFLKRSGSITKIKVAQIEGVRFNSIFILNVTIFLNLSSSFLMNGFLLDLFL